MVKILSITVSVALLVVIFFIVNACSYIDHLVEEGEAYGFSIGDSKKQSYQKAMQIFADKKVFILYPLGSNNFGPHKKFNFINSEYKLIENRDVWKFYFDDGFFDFIKLTFSNDALISIYRHRKKHELP